MLSALKPSPRKMRFLPLIAATYFMVSGGPYGIEDILGGAGYARAIVILLALPVLWSLPTALMIGELASAIPAEGGFYVWVRRAMGPFWGYQEELAFALRQHFRHGHLSGHLCELPGEVQRNAHRRVAWLRVVPGSSGALLPLESSWRTGRR